MNIYGQYSMIDGYNFKNINQKAYTVIGITWIKSSVQQQRRDNNILHGLYLGKPGNRGEMTVEQAKGIRQVLAERLRTNPILSGLSVGIFARRENSRMGSISNLYQGYRQNHLIHSIPRKDNLRNLVQ